MSANSRRAFTKLLIVTAMSLWMLMLRPNPAWADCVDDYWDCLNWCNYDAWLCEVGCQSEPAGEARAACVDNCWDGETTCEQACWQGYHGWCI